MNDWSLLVRAALLLLLVLAAPCAARASNQDDLIVQDLDAAIADFEILIREAHDGAPNLLLRTTYRLGGAGGHLWFANVRVKAVFMRDDGEKKLTYQLGYVGELIDKQLMDFSGEDQIAGLSGIQPGKFDEAFFKMMNGDLAFARNFKDKVMERAARSPKREYYVRDVATVLDHTNIAAYQTSSLVGITTNHPERPWGVCFYAGTLDAIIPSLVTDIDYLKAATQDAAKIADDAHTLAERPSYGPAFCGLPANDASVGSAPAGILVGTPNEALAALVERQIVQLAAIKDALNRLLKSQE